MRSIKLALWGILVLLSLLWLAAEPDVFQSENVFALRAAMIQYSGVLAIGAMSIALVLALRPGWPETWLGGLDKMYRLHRWLGISALVFSLAHWLWFEGAGWAIDLGLVTRPERGPRPPIENPVQQFLAGLRDPAEGLGEWAFYISVLLIVLALVPRFSYWWFFKTHRLLAVTYLVLAFHTAVLAEFAYWTQPLGVVLAVLLACGTVAAVIVLLRRVGISRQAMGNITALTKYPGVRALEIGMTMEPGWCGHQPGQFAFVTSDKGEGAHPFTIASAWNATDRSITFITKALGDYTSRLPDTLSVGQEVRVEGPYGRFTFDDGCPRQIWIGGGIGITPFIARMKYLAAQPDRRAGQAIDLFHSSAELDEDAFARLTADAAAAGVRLHIFINARDGLLTGERIRAAVPEWREASVWFCGPVGFADALKRDLAGQGFDVKTRFHQELFSMR
ncbi:MAG: ferric reductase-like transmembrane domain-containing protein [Rhizobiaceae bacterium]|nr:ferric reductase-like transmembrane domain-containing protein [Rhizobiaceae bacterium]